MKNKITIVTHSSKFHPDDVFGVATLMLLLEKENDITVIRSRDPEIISKAGEKGAVTVATNMAGRGVDIDSISEHHPMRYLYQKSPIWKFWEWRKPKTIALEAKGNPLHIYYDSRDKELSEVVRKAKGVFSELETTVRNW